MSCLYEFTMTVRVKTESPLKSELQLRNVRNIKAAVWYAVWAEHSRTSPLFKKAGLCRFSSRTFLMSVLLARQKTADKQHWWDTFMLFNSDLNSCKLINSWMSWIITRHATFWTFGHLFLYRCRPGIITPSQALYTFLILPCIKLYWRASNEYSLQPLKEVWNVWLKVEKDFLCMNKTEQEWKLISNSNVPA